MTVVDCGTPTNPVSGQVSHPTGTTFGRDATYRCDTGYNLVGGSSATRTCLATGMWSGSAPTCQGMLLLPWTCIQLKLIASQLSASVT